MTGRGLESGQDVIVGGPDDRGGMEYIGERGRLYATSSDGHGRVAFPDGEAFRFPFTSLNAIEDQERSEVTGEGTTIPPYIITALARPHLDERLNELIGDYKACGIGVVTVIITQTPDEENPGRVTYIGETYCTTGMAVAAVDYAARCTKETHDDYVAEGMTVIKDDEVKA